MGEGAGQGGNEDSGRGEEHTVAALDGLEAEPDGEMGLADAGRNSHILRSLCVLLHCREPEEGPPLSETSV